jgi:NAD(P)-dependent dehydrogenase (short-subunit alcohol dehydrogenase family)
MTAPLQGRHAVVTGAGRGIGAAIVRRLATDGARVTLLGRGIEALRQFAASLPPASAPQALACDVADPAQVAAAFAAARAAHGPVSILVNNAGQALTAPLVKTDDALWQRMLDVNLTGTFLCTRAALPDMLAAKSGRIVNVASTAGQRGYAYCSAYAASKHGVIGMTRSLALEVAAQGITVNAVCPGYSNTDIVAESVERIVRKTGRSRADAIAEFTRTNPQGRLIEPDEVADMVAWLCSEAAASVHGQSLSLSGGEVM